MPRKISIKQENVSGSEFEESKMVGSRFTNINLSGSRFHDINFTDVLFTAANLGGTMFKHIGPMPDKDGKQDQQRPVTFEEGMLCGSSFLRMDMTNVRIEDCVITGMQIDGILVADLVKAWKKRNKE
jgi:uncharacterized protein YjbI with pentapeptide repeats